MDVNGDANGDVNGRQSFVYDRGEVLHKKPPKVFGQVSEHDPVRPYLRSFP